MNRTHVRLVDTLSRCLGVQPSVSELTELVERWHGTAHYKNVHEAIGELEGRGYLDAERHGRGKAVSLALDRLETVDLLAEVEFDDKCRRREEGLRLDGFQDPVVEALQEEDRIECAFLVDAEANRRLNRLQVVALATPTQDDEEGAVRPQLSKIQGGLQALGRQVNTRIDGLVLSPREFVEALARPAIDPLQWLAARRTALIDPQRFWWLIAKAQTEGRAVRMRPVLDDRDQVLDLVGRLSEADLARNLSRFGYSEMGASTDEGRAVCFELVVIGALASQRPRRRYAAGVLLAKNSWNPRLLAFLARSKNLAPDLRAFLEHLDERDPRDVIDHTLELLPTVDEEEAVEIDEEQVDEMLELYEAQR